MLEEIKESKKENNKEDTEQKKAQKQNKKQKTNKQRKPVHPIKTMNEKIKVIQKENEKTKAVIRTQRWRLRIKLQKDNIDKQSTVPEENLTIVGPNMTEKRKNNKVYYNWPVSQTNHGGVKMLFFNK